MVWTALALDRPSLDRPSPGPPKISLFFYPHPPKNSFFSSLSGCLLDEFWVMADFGQTHFGQNRLWPKPTLAKTSLICCVLCCVAWALSPASRQTRAAALSTATTSQNPHHGARCAVVATRVEWQATPAGTHSGGKREPEAAQKKQTERLWIEPAVMGDREAGER